MYRQAKEAGSRKDVRDEILKEMGYDRIPLIPCPSPGFPYVVQVVTCLLVCHSHCYGFKNFHHIVDRCPDIRCTPDYPCTDCIEDIYRFKDFIKVVRAGEYSRQGEKNVQKRVKKFADIKKRHHRGLSKKGL